MKLLHAVVFGMLLGSGAAWAGLLDGTRWKITLTPDQESAENGEKAFTDELVFADDHLSAGTRRGFTPAVYMVTHTGAVVRWKTLQHSEAHGVANWTGEVDGDTVTGKLIMARRDGVRAVFTYTGERGRTKQNDRTD